MRRRLPAFNGIGLLLVGLLLSCATTRVEQPDVVRLTLVGTNDFHGWIEPQPRRGEGELEPVLGGIDAFAGYVDILRRQRPDEVILLDAGDMFQGTLVANLTRGSAVIRAYDAVGYDAAAVGNHEFDYGPDGADDGDPQGSLKARMAEASFPFLLGNVVESETGTAPRWSNAFRSVVLERNGLRVGVLGLVTTETPRVTHARNVEGLELLPLAPAALELAKELRGRGADVVVLSAHISGGCREAVDPHDLSSCDTGSELFRLLESLPEGTLDAVVAGHSHQVLAHFVHRVPVIESHSYGTAFGVIELHVDRRQRRVLGERTQIWKPTDICRSVFEDTGGCRSDGSGALLPVTFLEEEVRAQARVLDAVRADLQAVEVLRRERVGSVMGEDLKRARDRQSALGSLVTDAMRVAVPDADVAFTNSGGLRANLPAGPLTHGDVFTALPFDNRLAVLTVTGAELLALMERGFDGRHGVPQLNGLRIEVASAPRCPPGARRVISAELENGGALEPERTYRVVTNDFVASGGDGYGAVLSRIDPGRIEMDADLPYLRDALVKYLRGLSGPVHAPPGYEQRIRFVDRPCERAQDEGGVR